MDKFRKYVDKKFVSYPKSRALDELKEELITTLTERYQEFLEDGLDQERACQLSIESLGDCKETVNIIESGIEKRTKQLRTKMAVLAGMAYWLITSTVYLIISLVTQKWAYTWTMFPVAVAIFLCVILFLLFPKGRSLGKNLKIRINLLLAIFAITLGAYFLVSFFSKQWAVTWVMILFGLSLGFVFDAILIRKSHKRLFLIYIYIIVAFLTSAIHYLIMHFDLIDDSISWIIYLFAVIGLIIFNLVRVYKNYKNETSFKS